jgi:hypothetical protein
MNRIKAFLAVHAQAVSELVCALTALVTPFRF